MESKKFIVLLLLVLSPQISNGQSWCVAKPGAPATSLENALNYACGPQGRADCSKIQPSGPCFVPNTLPSHASFAFNSYYKKFVSTGATCNFNGVAMLTNINPSYGGCQYD